MDEAKAYYESAAKLAKAVLESEEAMAVSLETMMGIHRTFLADLKRTRDMVVTNIERIKVVIDETGQETL